MSDTTDLMPGAVVLPLAAVVALSGAHFIRDTGYAAIASALLLCSALLLARAATAAPRPTSPLVRRDLLIMGLATLGLALHLRESVSWLSRNGVSGEGRTVALVALGVGAGMALVAVGTRSRRVGFLAVLFMVASNAVVGWMIVSTGDRLTYDVVEFQRIGATALLEGLNPYTATYPDIYPPEISRRVYGEGISVDGVLTRGFPYPPTSLIPAVPAQAIGDVRLAHRIAIPAVALLVLLIGRGSAGSRIGAVMVLTAPNVINLPVGGWTEPFLAAALAATVALYRDGRRSAPLALGIFLSLKQYTALFLPLVPMLVGSPKGSLRIDRSDLRKIAFGLSPWLVFTLAFVVWDPSAFFDSVIFWQFDQPFRPDSLSLLVWSVNTLGWPPPSVYSLAPIVAGLVAGVLVLSRAERSPSGFALGVAFVMTCFLLLSKQAFANYYFLVVAGVSIAVAARAPSQA